MPVVMAKARARITAIFVMAMKQPVAPAVETVAAEVIEQPAPGVTEAGETCQAS